MPSLNHCDLLRHVGVNNLPKVVTRQRRGRELNLQPSSCKSNALAASYMYKLHARVYSFRELLGGNYAGSRCSKDSGTGIDCSQASLSSQLPHSQDWSAVDSQNSGTSQDLYQSSQAHQVQSASWNHAVAQWLSLSFALTLVLNLLDRKGIESEGFAWNIFMFGRSGLARSDWRKPGQLNNKKTTRLMALPYVCAYKSIRI